MAALAWLLIPLFAVVGAAIWGSWASRNKTIGDVAELAGYARFRDAMERSHTTPHDSARVELEPAAAAGGVTTSPSS
ncbi:hypothetical protein OG259_14640 [Streptomyces sp. NBC_00250]|uniref:hypothetical protein n=1 Tax=Streptomyces sp. NBC_00250 TaxID=2903641 RepID=UPI002E2C6307|nr:hypothetical protein [Streptomyces sp. NBC_00250]